MTTKSIHNITAIQHLNNETYIVGTDEQGNDFTLVVPTFELLEWIEIQSIKDSLIKYIKSC